MPTSSQARLAADVGCGYWIVADFDHGRSRTVTAARHRCLDGAAHFNLALARELPAVDECRHAMPAVKNSGNAGPIRTLHV
jgi:hypothetical protein